MKSLLSIFLAIGTVVVSAAGPDTPPPGLHYYYPVPSANPPRVIEADICVYGGTPGGVAAAVQSARMGKKAVLVVMRRHVGGMTSGGLTSTDIGKRDAIGGFANEVYAKIGRTSGFRPSQAEKAFLELLQEAGVPIFYEHRLKEVVKDGARITAIRIENGNTVKAKVFMDATYEGDLMAAAGVSFHVGREGNAAYGEMINGVQFRKSHNFAVPVDPYCKPGDPASGLLPTISTEPPGRAGDGDKKVQAYNFRMQLANAADRLPFPKPAGYDRDRYALLERYLAAHPHQPVPLHPGDCNNNGGFSTDHIGANYAWPEADYATREKIFQDHVNYQQGLMWFCANDSAVPAAIREKTLSFGLMAGEFPETGGWPHELYVREGRRMISDYVMTEANCTSRIKAEDSVGLASYTMDSHNCQRVVIDGVVRNEGDVQTGVPRPYPVSYRSLVPKESQCTNLFVPVCLSSSHMAYGSIRMEPVFMILGQSSATAASMAIDANIPVQKVDYAKLRERLLADKQALEWTGPSTVAHISDPEPPGGVLVGHSAAKSTGEWLTSAVADYLHDGNAGKGTKSITYTPELPADGAYDIWLRWPKNANRATNVPVEIVSAAGTETVKVNQREKGGWVKIATAKFKAGKSGSLTISNKDTDGHVVADAVKWVPAGK
jgi:hypothetical protein